MTSLTLNKITAQRGISVGEATKRISDLGWQPSYVQEANTFPTDYKIAKAPRDPMKQVLRSYFPMQEEKDNRVYGALDAALRGDMFRKAFQRRQESVLLRLRALGWSDADIVAMTVRQLDAVDFEGGEAEAQRPRYREALARRGLARWPGDLAFRTWQGEPIAADALRAHLSVLRQVRISMEFNGALCRGLQGARYKEVAEIDGEPTLVDFMLGRMPRQRSRQTSLTPG